MSTESELKRYRDQVSKLRSEVGRHSSTVATKRKKAADAMSAASRSRSDSTRRMKEREAEAATKDANTAEKKRADAESKLATAEKKAFELQTRHEKEQQKSYERSLKSLQRSAQQASVQFTMVSQSIGTPRPQTTSSSAYGQYDVFLSHASEDKDEIARPLLEALEQLGLTVWFDELKIKVGQSIRQEIETGISGAKFGVVVLSPSFFAKQWTQAELDALFDKKITTGQNLILPIWHRVTKDEVASHSPLLAGLLALNTSMMTVEDIASAIADVVQDND